MITKILLLILITVSAFAAKERISLSKLNETTQSLTTIETVVKDWDLKNLRDGQNENQKCDIVIADKESTVAVTIIQKASTTENHRQDREMTVELSKKQLLVQMTDVMHGAGRDDAYSILKQSNKDNTKLKLTGPFLKIGITEGLVTVQLQQNEYNVATCEFIESAQQ